MKNLIYILFATLILSSCSSENDNIPSSNDGTKLYTVTLSIQNPSLIVDQSQIRSTEDESTIDKLVVSLYKSTGEIYTNIPYATDSIKKEDGSFQITLQLPANNYKVAILGSNITNSFLYPETKDFYTDYYYGYAFSNAGVFYNTTDFAVQPIDEAQIITPIELQPMWSTINIAIQDAQTFDVPDETNALEFVVKPLYNGFGMYDKLATNNERPGISRSIVDLNIVRANSSYRNTVIVSKTIADKNKLSISINYLKKGSDSEYTILGTRDLKIPNINLENGYHYNINGYLNRKTNQSKNISLVEFNKKDINIEF